MTSRTLHIATPASKAAKTAAPLSLRGLWATAAAMHRTRVTRRLLAEMDARLLADIGASRSDAMMESARPFYDLAR